MVCGKPVPEGSRSDRIYCSDTCRNRSGHLRKIAVGYRRTPRPAQVTCGCGRVFRPARVGRVRRTCRYCQIGKLAVAYPGGSWNISHTASQLHLTVAELRAFIEAGRLKSTDERIRMEDLTAFLADPKTVQDVLP